MKEQSQKQEWGPLSNPSFCNVEHLHQVSASWPAPGAANPGSKLLLSNAQLRLRAYGVAKSKARVGPPLKSFLLQWRTPTPSL